MPETNPRYIAQNAKSRFLIRRGAAVLLGALFMTWPALYNRYPMLYPDSMTYIGDGLPVARALFLHKFSDYYGVRSFIYSLGILPWHWNVNLWPVVAMQALLAAYVIWLVVRSILPLGAVLRYLILAALLSLLTSLSWFVCLIMPDILGSLLYLCIYLLVFARETLSRVERVILGLIAWWGIASHATHLMLAAGICILFALLLILRSRLMRGRWRAVGEVAMIVLLAAGAQVALHTYLYGEPSLNGDRPPFLMARVIADGPGRWYLQQYCPERKFTICEHLQYLNDDSNEFIWGAKGFWQSADDDTRKRVIHEEMPFVLATLHAFPRPLLSKSAANFGQQLLAFGVYDFDANDWVLEEFDHMLPGERPRYLHGRQAHNSLPLEFFSSLQYWTIVASLVVSGAFTLVTWRRRPLPLVGLTVVIVSTVVANAFVTGVLSTVEDRYESRVIWLLPFLAGLCVLHWLDRWERDRAGYQEL